ncbi:MAG: hypothetical protein Q8S54_00640 [Bacteroidota bacterium]|nr:hypothetical protein [Odoribacter sp.]MDP3641675.1 hypothetical protein [Bacteroidota bacterium]
MLKEYTRQYAEIWDACSTCLPQFTKSYSTYEKLQKEQTLDQFLQSIQSFRKPRISCKILNDADQQVFLSNTSEFLRVGLYFTESQLEMMFSGDLIEGTRKFVRQARAFDPGLTFHDISQACRNIWIMNGLQIIMGIPMQLTPSFFAYSLLYPYTDNLIDDPKISGLD